MSVELNPAIPQLDADSLCYSIYMQLYTNLFNAHDKKDAEHPWGIVEGDEISIRLHNTAYHFADAISGAVDGSGSGGEGGVLIDYLKKAGGNMTGLLRANFGFEGGVHNTRVLEAYRQTVTGDNGSDTDIYGVQITGELRIGETDLYIGGENIIVYNKLLSTTSLYGNTIRLNGARIVSEGEFIIGEDKDSGVFISPSSLLIHGNVVFHSGNANSDVIDWSMKDGIVSGDLVISGQTTLSGSLSALNGFEIGVKNQAYLSIDTDGVIHSRSFLSFSENSGIKINNIPVFVRINSNDIQLGGVNGNLFLGSDQTTKIRLFSDLYDVDGDYKLLSKYGSAFFPDGLVVRHNYGDDLVSSYRVNSSDEGVVIYKNLRFGSLSGCSLSGNVEELVFNASITRMVSGEGMKTFVYASSFCYQASTSKYQPLNRTSNSFYLSTETDFFTFSKPVESKGHIGIDESFTQLRDGCLFFTNEHFLLSGTDGIKHYGNAYFLGSISSELFSSGLSGSGWAIVRNKTTGNVVATFDELTVRKKMRVYEMEVQKQNITNGSLWVSDSCSGDNVIQLP